MLKIGVIGAGNIARCHAMVLQKFDNARVVAIADVNEEMAKLRAETFHIDQYYTDYHRILEDPEIDAVTVATPIFTHQKIVVEALKAGKHVMCEKPPCKNVAEVEQCVKAAEETGKILMWGFLCRFRKDVQFMKEYIDAGHMGKIYQAEACRIDRCSLLGGWFIDKEKAGGGMLAEAEDLMRFIEDQFVVWGNFAPWNYRMDLVKLRGEISEWTSPAGLEQYRWAMPIDSSTASIISAFLALYAANGNPVLLEKACVLGDAITRMQNSKNGLIPTHWMDKNCRENGGNFWINCMIHTADVMFILAETAEKS